VAADEPDLDLDRDLDSDEPDVDSLARAASTGDARALDALLVAVRPEVMRLCGRFLPNREDAEEACQDALLAVARGLSGFDGRSSFRTWLYRVTANRARSTYRGLRRRWQSEAVPEQLPDPPDPRRTSVIAGTRLDLLEGLDAIGVDLAEPVALRDVLGLDYREIARVLGVAEGTARARVHRGRRRLREHLGDG
jgi:RNA polymerase sigma factor (sigma-70 family)